MSVTVTRLAKAYGAVKVLRDVTFSISSRGVVAIVGPSGCGKTTLLNVISGLDSADAGSTTSDGTIGYMLQDPLLLTWRTLAENGMLGIELTAGRNSESSTCLKDYFEAFDLGDAMSNYPSESSGGMKQRVALIRTLLAMPSILLLDEPFSSLDFDVKLKVQRHLIDYQRRREATILLVTHDIEDAIALSDEVIVLSNKPAHVRAVIPIDLGLTERNPIEARKSPLFAQYFARIWDEIKHPDSGQPTHAIH